MSYLELLQEFDEKVRENQSVKSSLIGEAMAGIQICSNTLSNLRIAVAKNGFKNEDDEIHFFKNVKSEPLRLLIYYTEVRSCEMKMPKWGLQAKFEYIDLEIDRINFFFDHNLDFQLYMNNGGGEKDKRYFLRKNLEDRPLNTSHPYYRDPLFNTSHDELWSMIIGFGLYGDYLDTLKTKVPDTSTKTSGLPETIHPPYRFTMPATAAMEFIYAFKEVKAFNHGNFDIKPFTEYFCKVFGIEIKDPYGLFAQITNRKTKRAKYIQILLDAFLNSLERRDE